MSTPVEKFKIIATAGLFCAAIAVPLTAAFVTTFLAAPNKAFANGKEMVETFLSMCLFAAIPVGSFALLAGGIGGAWLSIRAEHFRSRKHLFVESAFVGIVLSLIFPFFHWAMAWSGDRSNVTFNIKEIMLSISVGLPCAVLFVLFFGRLLGVAPPLVGSPKTAE
jgi:hypothetical protein